VNHSGAQSSTAARQQQNLALLRRLKRHRPGPRCGLFYTVLSDLPAVAAAVKPATMKAAVEAFKAFMEAFVKPSMEGAM
jgi:hypothetical protein